MWEDFDRIKDYMTSFDLWKNYDENIKIYQDIIDKLNLEIRRIKQIIFDDIFKELKLIGFHRYENDYCYIRVNPTGVKYDERNFEFNITLREDKSFDVYIDIFNDFYKYPKRETINIKTRTDVELFLETIRNSWSQYKPYSRHLKLNRLLNEKNN